MAAWQALRDNLPALLKKYQQENLPLLGLVDKGWTVSLRHLEDNYDLHPNHFSYKIHAAASHHPNEQKNLLSKLEDACANLRRHAKPESDMNRNAVYIHLPADAPIKKCQSWTENYFEDFPEQPLSKVIFYQPAVTVNLQEGTTALTHTFMQSEKAEQSWPSPGKVKGVIPVGLISDQPSTLELHAGDKKLTIEDHYLYQSGHYYVKARKNNGSEVFDLCKRAPGVFIHGASDDFVLKGHFLPANELVIV